MKRPRWSILVYSSGSSKARRIAVTAGLLALCAAVVIAGGAGLCRCLYAAGSYAYTKLCIFSEQNENRKLMETVAFLERFAQGYSGRIESLVAFEDRTRLSFGMNPISDDVRKAGIGGEPSAEQTVLASLTDPRVVEADTLHERIVSLSRQVKLQNTTFARMAGFVVTRNEEWAQRPSIWPASGRVTSTFGARVDPLFEEQRFHSGIDIANLTWTPVLAAADGIVSFVGVKQNFGNVVSIDHHGSGYETVYAHLQQAAVVEGQPVKRGELIGFLGTSGKSTGPHLHYEVHKFKKAVNPLSFILPVDAMVD